MSGCHWQGRRPGESDNEPTGPMPEAGLPNDRTPEAANPRVRRWPGHLGVGS